MKLMEVDIGPKCTDRRVQLFLDPVDWTFRTRTRTRTRLIKLTRTRTRTFYSFKNVLIFSKFFSNLKLSVGLKIQDAFIRLLIEKLAHLVYFSRNFEGDFIKIISYLVLIMRRRSSGPKKFGPGPGPGRLHFFGPGPYPDPTGSGSGTYPTISTWGVLQDTPSGYAQLL